MGYKLHTEEEEKQMVQEYIDGVPVNVLMAKYGYKTKKSITDKLKKHYQGNIAEAIKTARNNRKDYEMNFDGVTSIFNAYFLGLMLTDGYIQDENKFGIDLTDEDCIAFLSKVTGKTYNCYDYDEDTKPRYRIIFSNDNSVKTLAKYSVVPRKSKILEGVKLSPEEEKFLPYIIRGIIDGDGCVYQTSYGAPAFYVCSASYEFIKWVKDILENKFYFKELSIVQSETGLWRIDTANQQNILKLLVLVYDKPYGMSRKYELIRKTFRDYNKDNLLVEEQQY